MKKDILNELDNTRNDVLIIKPNNQQTLYKRDDILAENLSQIFCDKVIKFLSQNNLLNDKLKNKAVDFFEFEDEIDVAISNLNKKG